VNEYLEVQALPSVWALGDCALVPNGKNGGFHPPTAQHALREGRCVAGNVAAEIPGRRKKPFRFATLDSLAAIASALEWRMSSGSSSLAFWLGGFGALSIYLFKLPRFEKKGLLSIGRWIYASRRISHA
jgi:NADH dehydrogenase